MRETLTGVKSGKKIKKYFTSSPGQVDAGQPENAYSVVLEVILLANEPNPQLRMFRKLDDDLAPLDIPEGVRIRTYEPGDESHWADIMNRGLSENMTPEQARRDIMDQPQFDPEGLFFAELDSGETVGSACAWLDKPDETRYGLVHMVCVKPEARGKNVGYLLTLAVLHYFQAKTEIRDIYLLTDDFRLPAIKSYLRLGFTPVMDHPSFEQRWADIMQKIEQAGKAK